MSTCAELQASLAAAEAALNGLATGSKAESVQYGEKRVSFTPVTMGDLSRYVEELRREVAACTGATRLNRRVFGVIPEG